MGVTAQLRKMNLGDNLGSQSEEHTPSVLKKFVKKKNMRNWKINSVYLKTILRRVVTKPRSRLITGTAANRCRACYSPLGY